MKTQPINAANSQPAATAKSPPIHKAKPQPLATGILPPIPLSELQGAAAGFSAIAGVTTPSEINTLISDGVAQVELRNEKRRLKKEQKARHAEAMKSVPAIFVRFGHEAEERGLRAQTHSGNVDPGVLRAAESLFRDVPASVVEYKFPIRKLLYQVRKDLAEVNSDPSKTEADKAAAEKVAKTMIVAVRIAGGMYFYKKPKVTGVKPTGIKSPVATTIPDDTNTAAPDFSAPAGIVQADSSDEGRSKSNFSGNEGSLAPASVPDTALDIPVLVANTEMLPHAEIDGIARTLVANVEVAVLAAKAGSEQFGSPSAPGIGFTSKPIVPDGGLIDTPTESKGTKAVTEILRVDDSLAPTNLHNVLLKTPSGLGDTVHGAPILPGSERPSLASAFAEANSGVPVVIIDGEPAESGSTQATHSMETSPNSEEVGISNNASQPKRVMVAVAQAVHPAPLLAPNDGGFPERASQTDVPPISLATPRDGSTLPTATFPRSENPTVPPVAINALPTLSAKPSEVSETKRVISIDPDRHQQPAKQTGPNDQAVVAPSVFRDGSSGAPSTPPEKQSTDPIKVAEVKPQPPAVISAAAPPTKPLLLRGPNPISEAELRLLPNKIRGKTDRIVAKKANLRGGQGASVIPKALLKDWTTYCQDLDAKATGLGRRMRKHAQALHLYSHDPSDEVEFLVWMTQCPVEPPASLLGMLWKRMEWRA
jgi:hypothetical protein